MQLTAFDHEMFLRDYWQQKPLLIRNPWADWQNPVEPDILAGLACEDGIESRLITGQSGAEPREWALENGPFPESRFADLGREHWTLLVQAVDHYLPEVAALIAPFRFIPDWRIDDVMVSYAADGGGVGPHFDHYDVFLIQGHGRRHWKLGQRCDDSTALVPDCDVRQIADFQMTEEWICEPGDILYVPPGIAHDGSAIGDDCMTYSIGFRAPSRSELIGYWADDLLAAMTDDDRYGDPALPAQANPGEITPTALDQLHALVTEKLGDRAAFARWFGAYSSTPKYPDADWRPDEPIDRARLRQLIDEGQVLQRNPASRFTFIRDTDAALTLFVDGESFACNADSAAFAEQLCQSITAPIEATLLRSDAIAALVVQLCNQGSLIWDNG